MPDIQTPVPVQKLRTEFKVRSPFGLFLAEELIPVVLVSDLSGEVPAHSGYPRKCMGRLIVAAGGAGTQAQAVLQSRPNRGIVYVVDKAVCTETAAGSQSWEVRTGQDVTGLTERFTKTFRDLRATGAQAYQPDALMGDSVPLAASVDGQVVGSFNGLANTPLEIELGITLGGTEFVNIVVDNLNVVNRVTFYWTEYLAEDR